MSERKFWEREGIDPTFLALALWHEFMTGADPECADQIVRNARRQ